MWDKNFMMQSTNLNLRWRTADSWEGDIGGDAASYSDS